MISKVIVMMIKTPLLVLGHGRSSKHLATATVIHLPQSKTSPKGTFTKGERPMLYGRGMDPNTFTLPKLMPLLTLGSVL